MLYSIEIAQVFSSWSILTYLDDIQKILGRSLGDFSYPNTAMNILQIVEFLTEFFCYLLYYWHGHFKKNSECIKVPT